MHGNEKEHLHNAIIDSPARCILARAQHETPVTHETVCRKSGVNNFTVVTTNDTVFKLIIKKFEPIVLRYSVDYEIDRLGRHKEASIYFRLEDQGAILAYVKSI
jgi:hypothetical protein